MVISVSQFREFYPQLVGTAEDTLLGEMIDRADALIADYIRFPKVDGVSGTLQARAYVFLLGGKNLDVDDLRCLNVPVHPLVSLTSAHVDPDWEFGTDTEIATADLDVDLELGELWIRPTATSAAWDIGNRSNRVAVVAGWETLPPALVVLVAMATRHLLDRRRNQGVSSSTRMGDITTVADVEDVLPQAVKEGLAPYVIHGR